MQQTIAINFDSSKKYYCAKKGGTAKFVKFLNKCLKKYTILIFTISDKIRIENWLKSHHIDPKLSDIRIIELPKFIMIGDKLEKFNDMLKYSIDIL